MYQILLQLGLCPDPGEELTALPKTPSWIYGACFYEESGRGEKERKVERGGEREDSGGM